MAESEHTTAKKIITFVRQAEQPCLPLSQEQLIDKILNEIGPTLAALLEQSKEAAESKESETMVDMMIPFVGVSTEFRNKLNQITSELPDDLTRAFGVGLMQQVFEKYWGKIGDPEEDESQEKRLVIWVDSMLDAYKASPRRYAKWNL